MTELAPFRVCHSCKVYTKDVENLSCPRCGGNVKHKYMVDEFPIDEYQRVNKHGDKPKQVKFGEPEEVKQ